MWYQLLDIEHRNVQYFYRTQRSCGQGYVFTRVCDSVHRGGGVSRQGEPPQTGRTPPDRENPPARRTPQTRQTPHHPPAPGRPPRQGGTPPGKQTPEYGLRAAGTHPTGMHSCSDYISNACWDISCLSCSRFVCWSNSNHMDGLHRFKIGLRRSSQ